MAIRRLEGYDRTVVGILVEYGRWNAAVAAIRTQGLEAIGFI